MKFFRRVTVCFLIAHATTACASSTLSQQPPTSRLWITVSDFSTIGTFYFGNDVHATYGIDDGGNGTFNLGEYECNLPPPPSGLEVYWTRIPGRPSEFAFLCLDYRPVPSNAAKKDTFKLAVYRFSDPDSTVYFDWPDSFYLRARCDSIFFIYRDSTNGPKVIDMFKQNHLAIPAANTRGIGYAFIYKYGAALVDEVRQDRGTVAERFSLEQNYPNPFNPSTEIRYQIADFSHVEIRVFDVLGRQMASVVNENQQPGLHIVSWDASDVSSGLYFYRLVAFPVSRSVPAFVDVKKMIVVK